MDLQVDECNPLLTRRIRICTNNVTVQTAWNNSDEAGINIKQMVIHLTCGID